MFTTVPAQLSTPTLLRLIEYLSTRGGSQDVYYAASIMSYNARAAGDRWPALRVIRANWREMVGSFSLITRRRGYVPFWIARLGTMAAATPAATSPMAVELRCTSYWNCRLKFMPVSYTHLTLPTICSV